MNPYQLNFSLSYLSTGIVMLGLSLFVYLKNRKNPVNITFAIYSLSIAWWSLASVPMISAQTREMATFFDRICLMGAIFIPTTLIHFTLTLLNLEESRKKHHKIMLFSFSLFFNLEFYPPFR